MVDRNERFDAETYDNGEDGSEFIHVNIYDTPASSSILQVSKTTLASELCEALANKLDLTPENFKYYGLVLVHSSFLEACSEDQRGSIQRCVRTLKPSENVEKVFIELKSRRCKKFDCTKSESRWYYKDYRTAPMEFADGGNTSGDESSDDEEDMTLSDLAYIRQAEKRGYLYRRSSKDNNVWRKRYCILTDKIWCVDTGIWRKEPKALCIKLSGNSRVHDQLPGVSCPNAIVINCNQGMFLFRAASTQEQQSWIDELHLRAMLTADNDAINMAEMIICDEESARCQKVQRAVSDILSNRMLLSALAAVNDDCLGDDGVVQPEDHNHNYSAKHQLPFHSSARSAKSNSYNRSSNSAVSLRGTGISTTSAEVQTPAGSSPKVTSLETLYSLKSDTITSSEKKKNSSNSRAKRTISLSKQTRSTVESSIFIKRYNSLLHNLHTHDRGLSSSPFGLFFGISGVLAFATAVQLFKEHFRHDVLVSPRKQWQSAVTIYRDHIESHLLRQGHIIKSVNSDGSIEFFVMDHFSTASNQPDSYPVGNTTVVGTNVHTPERACGIRSPHFQDHHNNEDGDNGNDESENSSAAKKVPCNVWDMVQGTLMTVHKGVFANIHTATSTSSSSWGKKKTEGNTGGGGGGSSKKQEDKPKDNNNFLSSSSSSNNKIKASNNDGGSISSMQAVATSNDAVVAALVSNSSNSNNNSSIIVSSSYNDNDKVLLGAADSIRQPASSRNRSNSLDPGSHTSSSSPSPAMLPPINEDESSAGGDRGDAGILSTGMNDDDICSSSSEKRRAENDGNNNVTVTTITITGEEKDDVNSNSGTSDYNEGDNINNEGDNINNEGDNINNEGDNITDNNSDSPTATDTTSATTPVGSAFWNWTRQISMNTNNMFASLQNIVGMPHPAANSGGMNEQQQAETDTDTYNILTIGGSNSRVAHRLIDPELRPEPELFDELLRELLAVVDGDVHLTDSRI